MSDCIFCKIIAGEIPSTKVYEDDHVFAFDDINPQAPVHTLVIPKQHIENLNDEPTKEVLAELFAAVPRVAEIKGVKDSGYRIIQNNGAESGQTVFHLHIHILGGRDLGEKLL